MDSLNLKTHGLTVRSVLLPSNLRCKDCDCHFHDDSNMSVVVEVHPHNQNVRNLYFCESCIQYHSPSAFTALILHGAYLGESIFIRKSQVFNN
jgi:hypothetical protein